MFIVAAAFFAPTLGAGIAAVGVSAAVVKTPLQWDELDFVDREGRLACHDFLRSLRS